ncbi:hypothetical protein LshimejAT787_1502080 [Lyophyllum shimeji]|uniref:Uncharacterized protein n=1 Tax=Lyophyllum shimeji TaxID=47721 RepID=A0A9P3PYW0_LYOSH|nr:hypothetical protein LshimejAT787_1502080 [Lyophyllum shimeji]
MSGTSTPISSFIVVSSRPIPIPIYLTEYFSFQETRRGANRAWEISEQLHHCHLNKPYHRVFLLAHSTPWLHSTPPVCFMSLPLCSCALTGSTSCFLHTSEALNAMDSNDYSGSSALQRRAPVVNLEGSDDAHLARSRVWSSLCL